MLKVRLDRDLRKSLLRGHPWVYRNAIKNFEELNEAQACQVLDSKGKPLGWGILDPQSQLTLRLLSTEKTPPNERELKARIEKAFCKRSTLISPQNNSYRLLNGEGDLLPGVVCDIYSSVAVLQFDGEGMESFWQSKPLAQWVAEITGCHSVHLKCRHHRELRTVLGEENQGVVSILENGVKFLVNIAEGQKTGFFLDQRENRKYVGQISGGKSVLNLFSYTGGFSVYAGLGGAKKVTSVDLAAPAIALSEENWSLNQLDSKSHRGVSENVFDFLDGSAEKFDVVIVDPPSMAPSEKTKKQAVQKYTELFAQAISVLNDGGDLILSSCSSHISFSDFFSIIDEALSKKRKTGQILNVSGQGMDHPFPHSCHELRYLKFVHLVL